jgi:hypothetical protein
VGCCICDTLRSSCLVELIGMSAVDHIPARLKSCSQPDIPHQPQPYRHAPLKDWCTRFSHKKILHALQFTHDKNAQPPFPCRLGKDCACSLDKRKKTKRNVGSKISLEVDTQINANRLKWLCDTVQLWNCALPALNYFSNINKWDIWFLLQFTSKKIGNFHTCRNTIGPKTHHPYIDTLETACPNVNATAPLLDINLAIKGILEHTLVKLALKHQANESKWVPSC